MRRPILYPLIWSFPALLHQLTETIKETIIRFASENVLLCYGMIYLIIFMETGAVIFPFLPGDSLLFILGYLCTLKSATAAGTVLRAEVIYPLLILAALTGDNVNYWIGRRLGRKLFNGEKVRFLNRKYLEKTEQYFQKYGGKTIIMARFLPIVRTFTPFVAGMGAMNYGRFLAFSVAGAVAWVGVCVTAGIFFGRIPVVQENFEYAIIGISLASGIPFLWEFINHRREAKRSKERGEAVDATDVEKAVSAVHNKDKVKPQV